MRRDELATNDEALFREVASDVMVGYLGLVTASGAPRSVALNFVAMGFDIYFHGALAGEKFELLEHGAQAGFTIVKEYSVIHQFQNLETFVAQFATSNWQEISTF